MSKVSYAMIKAAIEKGIDDIKENPERGIRNLVDLGEMFSTGRFQKAFFRVAQEELSDETSMYYKLVEDVICRTNSGILTTFGINLGYTSWTWAAKIIRQNEAQRGFNIPWCIIVNAGKGEILNVDLIASLIRQGKALGVFSYIFHLDQRYEAVDSLLNLLHGEPDCSFLLFVHPETITEEFVQRIVLAKNIMVSVDLDVLDESVCKRAINRLCAGQCMFGGFTRYDDLRHKFENTAILERCSMGRIPFLFLIQNEKRHPDLFGESKRALDAARAGLKYPVLPIDLYQDIAHIDQIISSNPCIIVVEEDGRIAVTYEDSREYCNLPSITQTSLRDILSAASTNP